MQKSNSNQAATTAHRRVQASTTLNRRYVQRPTKITENKQIIKRTSNMSRVKKSTDVMVSIKRSPKISRFNTQMGQAKKTQSKKTMIRVNSMSATSAKAQKTQQMQAKTVGNSAQEIMKTSSAQQMQEKAKTRMRERQNRMMAAQAQAQTKRPTAKELKDQAIKKALMSAATASTTEQQTAKAQKSSKGMGKMRFGFGRVMLALSCAAAAVFAIAYFVNLNMPDISLRVAAMQTGIDATYPGYVPRDYNISSITSEDAKITLEFSNSSNNTKFTLTEEASSWDSNALLTNYVKEAYKDNYTIVREQGLTIYISESSAAWVNGGIVYKLNANPGVLTNKHIRSIAVSL